MALYQSGAGLGALVGVGTTNPTSNLQVYGTPIAAGNVFSVLNTAASGNVAQFSSSSGTALIVNASGYVGIGTTNPIYIFDCYGIVRAGSTIGSSIYLTNSEVKWRGDGTAHFSIFNQNSTLQIRNTSGNSEPGTAGSNLLTINTTGYVGIGTTNPYVLLTAVGTCTFGPGAGTQTAGYHSGMVNIIGGGTRALLRIENNSSIGSPGIIFGEGGVFTEDTVPTIKKVQGTNNLAIMSGGNVGIGSTGPRCTLDVVGSGITEGIYAKRFYVSAPGDNTDSSGDNNTGGPWYGLGYSVDSGLTAYIQLASYNGLSFKTSGGNMVLTPGGSVGIGVTNPGYKLYVSGDVAATAWFRVQTDGTGLYSDSRGNGIQINGSTYGHIDTYGSGRGGWNGYSMGNTAYIMQSGNAHGMIAPAVGWSFYNDGTTSFMSYGGAWKMQTTSTGIWINSTEIAMEQYNSTASAKHVGVSGGGYAIGGMEIENTELVTNYRWSQKVHLRSHEYGVSQGRRLTVRENGNIGIGQETPAFKLHVSGGDSSFTYYGPNSTWSAYLLIGAGTNNRAAGRAQIISTNGNLHMDCGTGQEMYLNYYANGDGAGALCRQYGTFVCTGDIVAYWSDERLKTKVGKIENPLDKVCSLSAFKYLNNDIAKQYGFKEEKVYVGLSAQEVQKVLPEVVSRAPFDAGTDYDVGKGNSKSGENYLTVQYERIVPLLIEAIKEERKAREAVTCELRSLEERIKLLEQK
jgi:hypothetical protein